jgi:hypothetical protein
MEWKSIKEGRGVVGSGEEVGKAGKMDYLEFETFGHLLLIIFFRM